MTAQQETDRRRAHAASLAAQAKAKAKRDDAAYDAQQERLRMLDKLRAQEQQKEKRGAP